MEGAAPQDSAAGAPKRGGGHSGRLLLRMPESLHADLAKASQRAGLSLNGYIIDALTNAVRGKASPARAPAAPAPRRRLVERLLIVNVVILAVVGVLVVVLLIQALR